jgi:hypothetical protein
LRLLENSAESSGSKLSMQRHHSANIACRRWFSKNNMTPALARPFEARCSSARIASRPEMRGSLVTEYQVTSASKLRITAVPFPSVRDRFLDRNALAHRANFRALGDEEVVLLMDNRG